MVVVELAAGAIITGGLEVVLSVVVLAGEPVGEGELVIQPDNAHAPPRRTSPNAKRDPILCFIMINSPVETRFFQGTVEVVVVWVVVAGGGGAVTVVDEESEPASPLVP